MKIFDKTRLFGLTRGAAIVLGVILLGAVHAAWGIENILFDMGIPMRNM